VFDLALLDTRVLVEFDGPYHGYGEQIATDAKKDETAIAYGFALERRIVAAASVLSPAVISGL
jgi:very-short-patch-repair endonuclease